MGRNEEGPLMFDLDTCICFVTNQASKKVAEVFNKRLLSKGITRVQGTALYFMGENDKINQKRLAELMNIKDSTVTRLIDRMEREDLIYRKTDPNDRRSMLLNLTEKGKEYRKITLKIGQELSRDVSKNISDKNIEIFKDVLDKIVKNVAEMEE